MDVQLLIDIHPQIHVRFITGIYISPDLCSFFKFSNRHPILKSTSNDVTDVCPNPNQEIGHRSENLEKTPI